MCPKLFIFSAKNPIEMLIIEMDINVKISIPSIFFLNFKLKYNMAPSKAKMAPLAPTEYEFKNL